VAFFCSDFVHRELSKKESLTVALVAMSFDSAFILAWLSGWATKRFVRAGERNGYGNLSIAIWKDLA